MSAIKFRRARQPSDADVNMTPMLDIVFIMLIFFIVTATFLDEQGLDFTTPSYPEEPSIILVPSITIYIDAKNRVSVDNEIAELSAVPLRVERLLAEKPDAVISLRADARATLGPVVYIKDQMALAGRETVMKIDRPNVQ